MLPASSLRRSLMSAIAVGSPGWRSGLIRTIQISSGGAPACPRTTSGSSRIGGFCEKSPSQ